MPQALNEYVKRAEVDTGVHQGGTDSPLGQGAQYVGISYSERLADAGIAPSVGSKGDSYDNALAETINGL
jgi:transposase InsO family protein